MHMADALLSPAVGGVMWAASAGAIVCSSRRIELERDDRKIPLMGVLGAFVFAAQMINFSLPGTGSSGHLGGGLLLAILLGPSPALITIASVLLVQALFFADGGLLALGCNIFNLGFVPAFIAYPCFQKIAGTKEPSPSKMMAAAILAAVLSSQVGAFAVVMETACSGVSALPVGKFLAVMQPVHVAIGVVEGLVTAAVVKFIRTARPDILHHTVSPAAQGGRSVAGLVASFALLALLTAGGLSAVASKDPDGLEWAIAKITGKEELPGPGSAVHRRLELLQQSISWFPGYAPRPAVAAGAGGQTAAAAQAGMVPVSSIAGVVGTLATSLLVFGVAVLLKKRKARASLPY